MHEFTPGPRDENLILQAAVTKTSNFTGAWLDLGANFAPGGLGMPVAGAVDVTAADRSSSDETYNFLLEETDPDSGGSPDASKIVTASVPKAVTVSGSSSTVGTLLVKGFVAKRFVRLSLVVSGTTPSVSYSGYLNP